MSSITKGIGSNNVGFFSPSMSKEVIEGREVIENKSSEDLLPDSNILSTASYKYAGPLQGIKSTQQVNTDYSRFENHTFFSSAEVNVNVAFDKIINKFPFDGRKKDIEAFLDDFTGFERWVFDNFPKGRGYLFFSGSNDATVDHGTYIKVNDYKGTSFPTLTKANTGRTAIDPGINSISFETHIFIPSQANDNQVICQKLSGSDQAITLALSQSSVTTSCSVVFGVAYSGSFLSASADIDKGSFQHLVATLKRGGAGDKLQIFIDDRMQAESNTKTAFGEINMLAVPFIIGSGSSHNGIGGPSGSTETGPFIPKQTFSGALDEFRVFHDTRSIVDQELYGEKTIFASDKLKLYFKFNEPSGSLGNVTNLALDSSGNGLHSTISNFERTLRVTGSDAPIDGGLDVPMKYELDDFNPILFPGYNNVINLNTRLMVTASYYDKVNPNLITRLVPEHYLVEGRVQDNFDDYEGTFKTELTGSGLPGTAKTGSGQLMLSLLYVWAKHFDELKIVIDAFSTIKHTNYENVDGIPDPLLLSLFNKYGFVFPNLYSGATLEQYIDGDNLSHLVGRTKNSLQFIQNEMWRRLLINLREIINSKGTIHAIKAFFRSIGINPDKTVRIREYGGPTIHSIKNSRQNKIEVSTMLNFSGALVNSSPTNTDARGINTGIPLIRSPFLSGSRIETGYPEPNSTFVLKKQFPPHGISNRSSDGLFTSGSFTYEAIYKFPLTSSTKTYALSQSLVRLSVTGTNEGEQQGLVTNLIAEKNKLTLFMRPSNQSLAPILRLALTGVNIYDGDRWNVSFGRNRNDSIGSLQSSSYFLRTAKHSHGKITDSYITQSIFSEDRTNTRTNNVFESIIDTYNNSGSFIIIGSQSLKYFGTSKFLNDVTNVGNIGRITNFDGQIGHIRFWSKALELNEWKEHVRNFKSLGVNDPLNNFNFVTATTGSFERLRLDVTTDQPVTKSNAMGGITLFDFSQNAMSGVIGSPWDLENTGSNHNILDKKHYHMSGTGFQPNKPVVIAETFNYSHLSPFFDESQTNNKVRIRSYIDAEKALENNVAVAPYHKLTYAERPNDDNRFSIDFSATNALDEDIINIFATLKFLDNAIGDPVLQFSPDYPKLEQLRRIYFNRLTGKLNFKTFFDFFKWFDTSFGVFIDMLVPAETRFLGANFVIESHMLERNKFEYRFPDIYLEEAHRPPTREDILLRQLVARIKGF